MHNTTMFKTLLTLFSKKTATKAGFTLVESMVAISILSMAVTGPLLIAQKGIGSAIYARDQITAFYLAQEAVEYIRNVRDTNRIAAAWWLKQFCLPANANCSVVNASYKINSVYSNFNNNDGTVNTNAISECVSSCPVLSFDTTNKLYGYDTGMGGTWVPTPFTRTISVDNTVSVSGREALISVTIAWKTTLFAPPRTFTVREYILNF
jgi:prepilin-type N-terminal cleavage/methylation domain-containing protein